MALRSMMIDWLLQRHLLLIGNQGVGKNKLADRFLSMLQLEREYLQLHRDTTVQSLTIQPMLQNGVVVYQDSPLVSAVRYGRVLVVDEADKAPLEVVCILKSLAEDGEFTLGDGRTIMKPERMPEQLSQLNDPDFLPIAEGFRMIVLANRPGYPFLGNDFYRESYSWLKGNEGMRCPISLYRVPHSSQQSGMWGCLRLPCHRQSGCHLGGGAPPELWALRATGPPLWTHFTVQSGTGFGIRMRPTRFAPRGAALDF